MAAVGVCQLYSRHTSPRRGRADNHWSYPPLTSNAKSARGFFIVALLESATCIDSEKYTHLWEKDELFARDIGVGASIYRVGEA